MPKTKGKDLAELLRQIIGAVELRIADLQSKRALLTAMLDQKPANDTTELEIPRARRKMSPATKAKIRAAAKARWARERAMNAKGQSTKSGAKKVMAKPAKAQLTQAPSKKSPAKKKTAKTPTRGGAVQAAKSS